MKLIGPMKLTGQSDECRNETTWERGDVREPADCTADLPVCGPADRLVQPCRGPCEVVLRPGRRYAITSRSAKRAFADAAAGGRRVFAGDFSWRLGRCVRRAPLAAVALAKP